MLGPAKASSSSWQSVVEEAQGYPYFCQLIGAALWDEMEQTSKEVHESEELVLDRPAVDRALHRFALRRLDYYEGRYAEIASPDTLRAAGCVASMFTAETSSAGKSRVSVRKIEAEVEAALEGKFEKRVDALRALSDLGFVWHPPSSDVGTTPHYEPGIPSLMNYVLAQG